MGRLAAISIRQPGEDDDAPGIDAVGITGNEGHLGVVGRPHHPHVGRFHHADFFDNIRIRLPLGGDDDLVAGLQPVEVAERFAVDVVVARQDDVARPPRLAAAGVLADALLQLFPIVPLDDGIIATEGRNCLLYTSRCV